MRELIEIGVLTAVGAIVLLVLVLVLRRLARDNEPTLATDDEGPCYLDDEFDIRKTHADRVRAHAYRASIGIERAPWHEQERVRKARREQERERKKRQKQRRKLKGGRS